MAIWIMQSFITTDVLIRKLNLKNCIVFAIGISAFVTGEHG